MSLISKSTNIRAALRSRQRGFIINPFRFSAPCAENGYVWSAASVSDPDATATISAMVAGDTGTFMCLRNAPSSGIQHIYRSTDSGRTFSRISLGGTRDWRNLFYVGSNTWIIPLGNASASTTTLRSTDNGATWGTVTHGASGFYYGSAFGAGLIRYVRFNSTATVVSSDLGATWGSGPSTPANQNISFMSYYDGYWYAINNANSTIYRLDESTDTWGSYTYFGSTRVTYLDGQGPALFAITTTPEAFVSFDNGSTYTEIPDIESLLSTRRTRIMFNVTDGFYFFGTRANTTAAMEFHASFNAIDWFTMGSAPSIVSGTAVGLTAAAWDGTTVALGSQIHASTSMFYGECA